VRHSRTRDGVDERRLSATCNSQRAHLAFGTVLMGLTEVLQRTHRAVQNVKQVPPSRFLSFLPQTSSLFSFTHRPIPLRKNVYLMG
jgi:hypothetical protein